MKNKEKIIELLKTYEQIKEKSSVFTSEFTLASGAITALNQVLEILKPSNSRELENGVNDER